MKTILVSWLAYNNDFSNGILDLEGPNGVLHHDFIENYERHIWLIPWQEGLEKEKSREGHLKTYVNKSPIKEKIELRFLPIYDPININEIRGKAEKIIQELVSGDFQIEVFISPGTPAMQTAWYFIHLSFAVKLFQTRSKKYRNQEKVEREYIELKQERVPASVVVKQGLIHQRKSETAYIIDTVSLKPLYEKACKIAQTDDVTTLVLGASGTGKEHIARYIHENSSRKDGSFITVNCSAMGDELLESRLFGYKKGAFTGADRDTKGFFIEANNGTILLDEIGDISPYMQQSLLRVLQEKEIVPIGQTKPIKFDARVIAATNQDLIGMCSEGKFRWDLYYRLAVAELELPSLLDRGIDELKTMIEFFLKKKKQHFRRNKVIKLNKDAEKILLAYPFPGNIRELENLVERFYVFCEDQVKVSDLPRRVLIPDEKFSWKLTDVEKIHLKKALDYFNWNKQRVSNEVGIAYNTLQDRVNKYSLMP